MSDGMTTWECGTGSGFRLTVNYFAELCEFSLDLSEEFPERVDRDLGMVCSNMPPDAARWLRDRLSTLIEQHESLAAGAGLHPGGTPK